MFIRVVELVMIIVILLFLLQQVLWPALTSRPLFPMFRKKPKAVASLQKAREDLDVRNINKQVNKIRRKR